jgi:succinate dehydrogenase / fumarate reductase, cytochrome b subunit
MGSEQEARKGRKGETMADVNRGNRPLSPHLSIYRWHWQMATSILTRITGNALIGGAILVIWWFIAAAMGPGPFGWADAVLTSWFGDLVLTLSLWALWYHLLAGLRHLIWDTGRMLDIAQAELSSKVIVGLSIVLTILTILVI